MPRRWSVSSQLGASSSRSQRMMVPLRWPVASLRYVSLMAIALTLELERIPPNWLRGHRFSSLPRRSKTWIADLAFEDKIPAWVWLVAT